MLYVGAHVAKEDTYLRTVKKIIPLGGNAIQIFVSSPKSFKIHTISESDAAATREFLKWKKFPMLSHAKYTINLSKKGGASHHFYQQELNLTYQLGGFGSVVHMGKCVGLLPKEAIENMYHNLRKTIEKVFPNDAPTEKKKYFKIILETSAGCGSELFSNIKDLGKFYKGFTKAEQKYIKFCIDTCHIFAAGYDIRTKHGAIDFLEEFNNQIGLKNVVVFHLNDSKEPLGSHKDRHESIGAGYIGSSALGGSLGGFKEIIRYAKTARIPLILERGQQTTKEEIQFVKKLSS
jgi:deoxyribonuclease IV